MADVPLIGVTKRFGKATAVADLSLDIADGEFVVLLGPTGAGKTTTLRLVAGLEKPGRGPVRIGGRDVTDIAPAARDVTFVFQQYSLYPHLSVFDNLAFPLRSPARRMPEPSRSAAGSMRWPRSCASRTSSATGRPQLSGGEMQRVAIGRALVRRPAIYLMDEPLSSLDAKLARELRLELKRIQADLGATMLFVTHDQIEAMTMANRIGVLDHGRLVQLGTPRRSMRTRDSIYVATRLGQPPINLVPEGLLPAARRRRAPRPSGSNREHPDREGQWRRRHRQGRVGRASRRPEPSSSVGRRTADHDAGLARQRSRAGRPGQARGGQAAVLRCGRQPVAGIGMRPMDGSGHQASDRYAGRAGHRRERRADGARPGDRRRRSRHQHEARLRGGAGRGRGNHRLAISRRRCTSSA